jgi:hypothetical protein
MRGRGRARTLAGFNPAATTGRDDAPGSAAVAGPVLRPTSTRRRRRGGSSPRVARLWPGRCWSGFRRAAMVWQIGAVVNVATAPLTAGIAAVAVAVAVARMFASHLSGRAGSGVHARGAAKAGFVIVFSPPFVWPEPLCGPPRSLPALRRIAPGECRADPGGPVASAPSRCTCPGGPSAHARLTGVPVEKAFRVPSAPTWCACPGGLSPAPVLPCVLFGEVSALPESSPSRRQSGARAGVVLPACILTVQVRGSASRARQGARSGTGGVPCMMVMG